MAQGHPDAAQYPICSLWTEATIAQRRVNTLLATEANLTYLVVQTVMGGKESSDALSNAIEGLTNG